MKGIFSNPAKQNLQIHIDDRKYFFKEKNIYRQNLLQDSTFSVFNKDQKLILKF